MQTSKVIVDSENKIERRSFGRTTINRGALIYFAGREGVHACTVRDATNHGAGIRITGLNVLPFKFDISFDNFRTARQCRLIWRDGDFIGAQFLQD